jgi:hypothetical protein
MEALGNARLWSIVALFEISLSTAPLAAQFSARFDLATSTRYVRHGLSRAAGFIVQPSVAAGFGFHAITLAGGLVRHYELDHVGPGEISELGTGGGQIGEDDAWAEATLALGALRVKAGLLRSVFRGTAAISGAGPLGNTTEAYSAVALTTRYLNPSLEAWWDVSRVRGGFLLASASSPMIAWPYSPFFFISADGEVGMNLGQQPDAGRPDELANFASRGLTHAALGFNVLIRLQQWRGLGAANLDLGLKNQLNLDDATRYNGSGRSKDFIVWVTAGLSLLLGGEARVVR